MEGFLDLSASDLLGGFLQREETRAAAKQIEFDRAALQQSRALHAPEYDTSASAIDSGFAPVPGAGDGISINKPLLFAGIGLLVAAVLLKKVL